MAVHSFTRNYQRSNSFIDIGLSAGLNYSFLSQLFPPLLDYKKMTGWWYGDWEAFNFIFPGLVLIAFLISNVRYKQYPRIIAGYLLVFCVGGFIASGVCADVVKSLPIVKSFHVNPRWLMMLSLQFVILVVSFLNKPKLSAKISASYANNCPEGHFSVRSHPRNAHTKTDETAVSATLVKEKCRPYRTLKKPELNFTTQPPKNWLNPNEKFKGWSKEEIKIRSILEKLPKSIINIRKITFFRSLEKSIYPSVSNSDNQIIVIYDSLASYDLSRVISHELAHFY